MIFAEWKLDGVYKADANAVANEILSIGENATAEQILEKGRDETSELHKCFEWDDSIAAEKYRISQARDIVRLLVIKKPTEQTPQVRFFYKTDNGGYKPTQIIYRQANEYEMLLQRAYSELEAFKKKYEMLTELAELFEEIEKIVA